MRPHCIPGQMQTGKKFSDKNYIMSQQITAQVCRTIGDLEDFLATIDNGLYSTPSVNLSGGTVGQHTRHVIELFTCLLSGYSSGSVNYELRKRDALLQASTAAAITALRGIRGDISRPDKSLTLALCDEEGAAGQITTSYLRELLYNLEHTIHHMALIRVGIQELSDLTLPDRFGVAPCTMKYRKSVCVQ